MTTTGNPCAPHPTTGECKLLGHHLNPETCWEPATCHGCLPCPTHTGRKPATQVEAGNPVPRPAATTDARKRAAKKTCMCGTSTPADTTGPLIHTAVLCTAPDGQEPGA